jgi:GSCFA family
MDILYHPNNYWRYSVDQKAKLNQIAEHTKQPLITKTSAITSLGSCFADHIRMFLKDKDYNYVITEPNESGSSANWGRIYNPISLRQIIDYCNNSDWHPQERWWVDPQGRTLDPYRAVAPYADVQTAEEDFQRHLSLARKVFVAADVVILTYGLVEVWESALDGSVFQVRPVSFDLSRHRFSLLEYPECLQAIKSACAGIHCINPRAVIILTVSPVPLRATFRPDVTPGVANTYSKAVLLASVQTASRQLTNVHYFPSYEIVTECVGKPFREDGSVTPTAVEVVMDLFERSFVQQ